AGRRMEELCATLGLHTAWVGDAPGLVLGRIVCQVVNESAFAVAEGVGSAEDVDAGMVLGLNHPRGPLAWADAIGLDHVLALRAYPRLRPQSNQRAWVLTIAHRKALDHHRARARRAIPMERLPEPPSPGDASPDDDALWAQVRGLPPKQRAAVLLRYAGDLS